MERRRSKRKLVHIEAQLILDEDSYKGYIENISEQGIYIETAARDPLKTPKDFSPGTTVYVKFNLPSGEKIDLHCKITWAYQIAPHGLTTSIGLEIIFPPPHYLEFFKELT
jgi:hypothetical protein